MVAVICRDFQVKDLENITIFQFGGFSGIWLRLVWREEAGLDDEVSLCCGDGIFPILLNLAPVILLTFVPLQVLRVLFVVEDVTIDLLVGFGVNEIRQAYWQH